jgi:hypothetical protein
MLVLWKSKLTIGEKHMGITYAGSLLGGMIPPRTFQIAETCYEGQIVMDSIADVGTAHVQVLDVAAQDTEDDHRIVGVIGAVRNLNDLTVAGSGLGKTGTYDTTQATLILNDPIGPSEVDVWPAIPGISLFRAPIYNSTYGTAITELVVTSASTDGLAVTHASSTAIASPDKMTTAYCRKGANRGQSRIVTTVATGAQTLTVPFSYDIAVGDVFVTCGLKLGLSHVYFDATASFIDASAVLSSNWYDIFVWELNLDESGKEYAVFSFCDSCCALSGGVGVLGF